MESANENVCIRVVSPDRPTKGSVMLTENPRGSNPRKHCDDNASVKGKNSANQDAGCPAVRRNSSIGLSFLAGGISDSTHQLNGCAIPFGYSENPAASSREQRDHCPDSGRNYHANGCVPSYRPLVGSGAAAAYEALRHDYYVQKHNSQRRMSSLSFGSAEAGEFGINRDIELDALAPNNKDAKGIRGGVNSDEQFEMLKLHYFNLVNEIQETAMMLNICEQHQLMLQHQLENGHAPGGPEPAGRSKRPLPTDGSFEISVPTKIVKL